MLRELLFIQCLIINTILIKLDRFELIAITMTIMCMIHLLYHYNNWYFIIEESFTEVKQHIDSELIKHQPTPSYIVHFQIFVITILIFQRIRRERRG